MQNKNTIYMCCLWVLLELSLESGTIGQNTKISTGRCNQRMKFSESEMRKFSIQSVNPLSIWIFIPQILASEG